MFANEIIDLMGNSFLAKPLETWRGSPKQQIELLQKMESNACSSAYTMFLWAMLMMKMHPWILSIRLLQAQTLPYQNGHAHFADA